MAEPRHEDQACPNCSAMQARIEALLDELELTAGHDDDDAANPAEKAKFRRTHVTGLIAQLAINRLLRETMHPIRAIQVLIRMLDNQVQFPMIMLGELIHTHAPKAAPAAAPGAPQTMSDEELLAFDETKLPKA